MKLLKNKTYREGLARLNEVEKELKETKQRLENSDRLKKQLRVKFDEELERNAELTDENARLKMKISRKEQPRQNGRFVKVAVEQ